MKRFTLILILTMTVLLGSSGACWSNDLEKGWEAYLNQDYATALKEWTPLAKQGDVGARYYLGLMYENGFGVPEDDKIAVKWFKLAAEQGEANAQYNLGVMYEQGQGVSQDYQTAMKWWGLAAEQGHTDAQYNLGVMYGKGQSAPPDSVRAHMWFDVAASSGAEYASKNRDIVANAMTAEQIVEAQKLARECVKKNYKGC